VKTIWKYDPVADGDFEKTGRFTLRLPRGAFFCHAAPQTPGAMYPMLWFEVDTEKEKEEQNFAFVPTGGEIPERDYEDGTPPGTPVRVPWVYVATAVCAGGELVWHVYVEPDTGLPF
jgi:hypothetical protein